MTKTNILAALAIAALATVSSPNVGFAQAKPFKLCTGNAAGNYFWAGNEFAKQAGGGAIQVLETSGSMQNLDKILDGSCDGAFVQNDALRVYSARNPRILPAVERASSLYPEAVHLICNRAGGVSNIMSLTSQHRVAVGRDTGSTVTWDNLVAAAKDTLGKVSTDPKTGVRALNAVSDGAEVTCSLHVSALNSSLFTNDAQKLSEKIVLVPVADSAFTTLKDEKGRSIYSTVTVPSDTYKNIMPSGAIYGKKDVQTIAVDAIFVVSTTYADEQTNAYDTLLRALGRAKPAILQHVGIAQ